MKKADVPFAAFLVLIFLILVWPQPRVESREDHAFGLVTAETSLGVSGSWNRIMAVKHWKTGRCFVIVAGHSQSGKAMVETDRAVCQ